MTTLDLKRLLAFAQNVSIDGARLIINAGHAHKIASKKTAIDLVTDVDVAVNELLCTHLAQANETIDIVAEEGVLESLRKKDARFAWIIDPIDGTTNFVHGINHSAISIALYDRKEQESLLGVVLNPFSNECFTALKGGGAFLNGTSIKVSAVTTLSDAVICTGFAYDRKTNPDNNLAEFSAVMPNVQGIRRFGAASLDLAYVAAGRFDGYFERGLKFWDYAAGILLVQEAFGIACAYDGSPLREQSGHVIAANPQLFPILRQTVENARLNAGFPVLPSSFTSK